MISILMPSRRRPEFVKRAIGSIVDTVSNSANVELILRVDQDDQSNYMGCFDGIPKSKIVIRETTFPDMGKLWNEAFSFCIGDIVQMGADDIFYHTPDWDLMVEEEFRKCEDKILLVWGKDGGHNNLLSTHGFVSRKWVETVGYFSPPYGMVYGNDDWVFLIARELGRQKYLPDMFIEHQREGIGTRRLRQFKQLSTDQVYSEWGRLLRQKAVDKLRKEMK
jgi:glycosyltransferase involved in cell wall biosynthesis